MWTDRQLAAHSSQLWCHGDGDGEGDGDGGWGMSRVVFTGKGSRDSIARTRHLVHRRHCRAQPARGALRFVFATWAGGGACIFQKAPAPAPATPFNFSCLLREDVRTPCQKPNRENSGFNAGNVVGEKQRTDAHACLESLKHDAIVSSSSSLSSPVTACVCFLLSMPP